MTAGPRRWQARHMAPRPTGRDWLVAGLLTLLCVVAPRAGPPAPEDPPWVAAVGLGLGLLQGLPTAWRRTHPSAVAAMVVPAYVAYAVVVDSVPPYAGWVVLFAVIVYVREPRRAAVLGGILAVVLMAGHGLADVLHRQGLGDVPIVLLLTVVVALAGALTRAELGRVAALRERAASLERERDAVRAQAALEERLRVARELHDVVGHGLSAISVQSGAARVALDAGELGAVQAALSNVEATSREALQEMRQVLGVLRARSTAAPPGLAELDELIGQAAGVRASVTRSGNLSQVSPTVGLCAYRIVQEALTNVARHATDAKVTVAVAAVDGQLRVEVTDTGPAKIRSQSPSVGHGLLGMRERVQALHGTFDAGPTGSGGWRVRAVLPLDEHGGR
jgi:signal transduction histidine kinase